MSIVESSGWTTEDLNPYRDLSSAFRLMEEVPGTRMRRMMQLSVMPHAIAGLFRNIQSPIQFRDPRKTLQRLIKEGMGFTVDPELLEVGGVYHYKAGDVELLLKKVDEDRIEVHEILDGPVE